jgi:hypothetical protein
MVTLPSVRAFAVTAVPVEVAIWPSWSARTPVVRFTPIVSPTFAPTWNWAEPKLPSRTFWPLNEVCEAMRFTSARRCWTSWSRAARSEALFVALADWTASSRMRCRLLVSSSRADSAVWADGLVQAADLRGEAVGDRKSRGIVLRAVDAQAGRQTLQGGRQGAVRTRQIALRIQGKHVGIDNDWHESLSFG